MRIALFTTIFPSIARWLPEWAESVENQIFKDFEICVALDSMTPIQAISACKRELNTKWFKAPTGSSPAVVRTHALDQIVKDYDAIVFVDADDIMLPNRMEQAKKDLEYSDVASCGMALIDEHGNDLDQVFNPDIGVDNLWRVNVFGFGNSIYRTDVLRLFLAIPDYCVLIDWFVSTMVYIHGHRMITNRVPQMKYRQHGKNTARVLSPFNEQQIITAATLVNNHYNFLELHLDSLPEGLQNAKENARKFYKTITAKKQVLGSYVKALNELNANHVWWSCVAHPDIEEIWKI